MRLPPAPCTAGMLSSITSAWVGTAQAPRSSTKLKAARASRTRRAMAERVGTSLVWAAPLASCALTTMLSAPWRYSSTSRERCRATGLKPIISNTWPSACGLAVAYSMNSIPSIPSGFAASLNEACKGSRPSWGRVSKSLMASPKQQRVWRQQPHPKISAQCADRPATRWRVFAAPNDRIPARWLRLTP